jgi:prepilin-type N-terminal cleavage/methylation domain-containing protein
MKNIKIQKKAFTLVELIVVITILAILGTIAFISLQGNTQDAKNTKVVSDVANIHKKVSIRIAEENAPVLADFFLSGSSISANKHSNTST